jgi:hypothetical protein
LKKDEAIISPKETRLSSHKYSTPDCLVPVQAGNSKKRAFVNLVDSSQSIDHKDYHKSEKIDNEDSDPFSDFELEMKNDVEKQDLFTDATCDLFTNILEKQPELTVPHQSILKEIESIENEIIFEESRGNQVTETTIVSGDDDEKYFDSFDFDHIALPDDLVPSHISGEIEKGYLGSDLSSIHSIKKLKKSRLVIHESSSPQPEASFIQKSLSFSSPLFIPSNRKTLKERVLQKYTRKPPKNRNPTANSDFESKIKPKNFEKKSSKKPKSKNLLAAEFIDLEVEVSGDECSGDEEEGSEDDLSGFIVGSLHNKSKNHHGFYRQSLLSPNQGGFGKAYGNKFRLAQIHYSNQINDTPVKPDDEDDPESLIDFVVNDSQIEFESQIVDSFLDESSEVEVQQSKPITIIPESPNRKDVVIQEDYFDESFDLETVNLDELMEFENALV